MDGEMAWLMKRLLPQHQELGSEPGINTKSWKWRHIPIYDSSGEIETGGSLGVLES